MVDELWSASLLYLFKHFYGGNHYYISPDEIGTNSKDAWLLQDGGLIVLCCKNLKHFFLSQVSAGLKVEHLIWFICSLHRPLVTIWVLMKSVFIWSLSHRYFSTWQIPFKVDLASKCKLCLFGSSTYKHNMKHLKKSCIRRKVKNITYLAPWASTCSM